MALAAASNGKLYAVGGAHRGAGTQVWPTNLEYDPLADRWTNQALLPTPRRDLALVAAPNGQLYALGGLATSPFALAANEAYTPLGALAACTPPPRASPS